VATVMYKNILAAVLGGLILFTLIILPIANAEENKLTFNSIKSSENSGKPSANEHLVAYSISGIRNTLYYAFDFSNYPSDKTPELAIFYIKTYAVLDPCNVEAFYFSSADWVYTNSTSNSTVLTPTGAINYISDGDELYAYTSNSFIQAVKQACLEKGEFTVCLKAKSNIYGDSTVIFNPDATLDVIYSPITSNIPASPTPSIPEFQSLSLILILAVSSLVTTMAYKRSRIRE
jgi:hypothetical protein